MSSNFEIIVARISNGLVLNLKGDFDGTSAYELINFLKECPCDIPKIFIHTNDLKTVFPFGRDLFRKFLYCVEGQPSKIEVTGNEALTLSLEKESPCSTVARCDSAQPIVSTIQLG
jgi:hypothetical protein